MDEQLLRFKHFIAPWIPAYRSISTSYFVSRHGDNADLISARIVLHPLAPSSLQKRTNIEDKRLLAGLHISNADQSKIDAVIEDADFGQIKVGTKTFRLPADPGSSMHKWCHLDRQHLTNESTSAPRAPFVQVTGGSRISALNRAFDSDLQDWYLRGLNPAFADFDDLHGTYGLPSQHLAGSQTYFELVAYPPVEISDTSAISNGLARITVRMGKGLEREKLSIAYRIMREDELPTRGICEASQFIWKEASDTHTAIVEFNTEDAALVHCFLRYSGDAVQQCWLSDPTKHVNPRLAAHSAFDEDLGFLRKLLFDFKKNEAQNFEYGVSLLFHILGFSVSQHGRIPKLQDGPDIIAHTPSGRFVLIECTTSDLNENDKLAKLSRRSETLRSKLDKAGYSRSDILPVLATALRSVQVEKQREDADKKKILVLVREDLEQLLLRAALAPNPDGWIKESMLRESWPPLSR